MGEIVRRKETQLSTEKESHLIILTEKDKGKMEYFKTELDRLSSIEKTINDLKEKYNQAINERLIFKTKYEKEIELTKQLSTELNILKAYKTLIDLTCFCPDLKKKINIFDCNRGFNNYCRNKKDCSIRRILLEDIKNKYLD
jgi:hypothetical protein